MWWGRFSSSGEKLGDVADQAAAALSMTHASQRSSGWTPRRRIRKCRPLQLHTLIRLCPQFTGFWQPLIGQERQCHIVYPRCGDPALVERVSLSDCCVVLLVMLAGDGPSIFICHNLGSVGTCRFVDPFLLPCLLLHWHENRTNTRSTIPHDSVTEITENLPTQPGRKLPHTFVLLAFCGRSVAKPRQFMMKGSSRRMLLVAIGL